MYNSIALNVHAPKEDSFYERLEHVFHAFHDGLERVFNEFPKYHTEILVGDDLFTQTFRKKGLY
jgi:hypothetical protein